MKLRTYLIANVMLGNKGIPAGTEGDVEHDALAAHALLQAMEEWRALPSHNHAAQWSVEWIHGRANGLMREWTSKSEV